MTYRRIGAGLILNKLYKKNGIEHINKPLLSWCGNDLEYFESAKKLYSNPSYIVNKFIKSLDLEGLGAIPLTDVSKEIKSYEMDLKLKRLECESRIKSGEIIGNKISKGLESLGFSLSESIGKHAEKTLEGLQDLSFSVMMSGIGIADAISPSRGNIY